MLQIEKNTALVPTHFQCGLKCCEISDAQSETFSAADLGCRDNLDPFG